ncbi:MAG: zinc-finger domain-containing protein [Rhizobiaceae bacterium]|nr:zinc-finger domain-containing protein [Rhizobiaceae bacterium]
MKRTGARKFKNDHGVREIRIGLKEFMCAGASPPQDHPHIFLDMGDLDRIICPYCGTAFRFDPDLGPLESDPADSFFVDETEFD